ncbi:MAG TPA: substrate-binding domain-containing protein [Gaiellaceae bacterium]|jgi:branched-chain amino acid transport system substrate-binding protein|nr:substrate-binding domain-containing protein [Gaiellaceae bacterium]
MMQQGGKVKRALALVLAVTVAAIAGTAVAGVRSTEGTSAKAPVKVGIIYSRTGLLSAFGAEYFQGLQLGLQYATKGSGKVNGRKIQFTFVDDAGDPAKAVSAAKDLIGQGYKIIGGSTSSGVGLAVAPIAAQNKVLFISGPAATDALTGANRYTFRSGRQSLQDVLAVKGILGKVPGKKIVVFAQDSAFGNGNVAAVRAVLGGAGHTVTPILVPLSAQDFTPFAQRANQANPDLLFVAWAGTTAPAMWRALEQQGTIRGTTVATGLAERATWGSYVAGINFLSHYVAEAPKNKVNNWLKAKMRAKSQVPDLFTPDGFVAAQMIVRAVQKSGGDDVERMISALEGWQFAAPKGLQRIRQSDHAMIQPMFQVRTRQVNGKWRAVPVKTFSPGNVAPPAKTFP